jgi:polysaccharide biosynthesis/export protein
MKSLGRDQLGPGLALIAGILLSVALLACQKQALKTPMEMASEPPPQLTLGPGDVLEVKFFYTPELNETQPVRPDGRITLQLVGDVDVSGKTAAELRESLGKAYAGQLKNPEIAVIVRSIFNRRVYVGGDVNRPGVVEMPSRLTALEAIMQAGGFDYRRAEVGNVVVIRHKDGKRYGCALDFNDALKGKEYQPFYLEPQDIVYVPRTVISQVNLWIDQYINQIVPRVGFTYSTTLGSGATIGFTPPTTVVTQP